MFLLMSFRGQALSSLVTVSAAGQTDYCGVHDRRQAALIKSMDKCEAALYKKSIGLVKKVLVRRRATADFSPVFQGRDLGLSEGRLFWPKPCEAKPKVKVRGPPFRQSLFSPQRCSCFSG
jgi:hypothetical protein